MTENYNTGLEFFEKSEFPEVNGVEFYRDIFPDNQNQYEKSDFFKPNAVFQYQVYAKKYEKNILAKQIMFADTWESMFNRYVKDNPFTLCSGSTFRGKSNLQADLSTVNALICDIDGVGGKELERLFIYFNRKLEEKEKIAFPMPLPTYIVLTGNGIHAYYVFNEPISVYPDKLNLMKLRQFRTAISKLLWIPQSSTNSDKNAPDTGSIKQGFRMVGSRNHKYDKRYNNNKGILIRAYKTGEKVSIDFLNQYLPTDERLVLTQYSLDEARELFPDWKPFTPTERVIYKNNYHRGLYEDWKKQPFTAVEAIGGRRYNYMEMIAIHAWRCNIPYDEMVADVKNAFEHLKTIPHDHELTEEDMESAIKTYDRHQNKLTLRYIEDLTGIKKIPNKRNGRKQKDHLKRARAVQEIDYPNGSWREGNGRPSAAVKVHEYRQAHPEAKPKDCIIYTGLSKNTVYKWWKEDKSHENN